MASDCVNHGILLSELKFYGKRGNFFSLIKIYLEGRYQKVQINVKNQTHHNIYRMEKSFLWGSTRFNSRVFVVSYVYQ